MTNLTDSEKRGALLAAIQAEGNKSPFNPNETITDPTTGEVYPLYKSLIHLMQAMILVNFETNPSIKEVMAEIITANINHFST